MLEIKRFFHLFSSEIESANPYAISMEGFLRKPKKVIPFDWEHGVTRENFIDWFMLGFRLSEGTYKAHNVFFEWTRVNLDFDYNQTLANFFESGKKYKWRFLSKEEKNLFGNSFRKVRMHSILSYTRPEYDPHSNEYILSLAEGEINNLYAEKKIKKDNGKIFLYDDLQELKDMPPEILKQRLRQHVKIKTVYGG